MAERTTRPRAPDPGRPEPSPLVPLDYPWPIVVGIDPGTRVLGWGVLARTPRRATLIAAGVLRPSRSASPAGRLAELARSLPELFARCRPSAVVVERAFAARNVQAAFRLGESRGVVLAFAAAAGADVVEIAPASARKAVVGRGACSKEQIAYMVKRLLEVPELDVPLDATDALALALAHVRALERLERLGVAPLPRRSGRVLRPCRAALERV